MAFKEAFKIYYWDTCQSEIYVIIMVFAIDCPRVEEKLAPANMSLVFTVMCEIRKRVRNNLNEVTSDKFWVHMQSHLEECYSICQSR